MVSSEPSAPARLVGRGDEGEALGRLLDDARDGTSGSLVVRGEAGMGKTALLDWAGESNAAPS